MCCSWHVRLTDDPAAEHLALDAVSARTAHRRQSQSSTRRLAEPMFIVSLEASGVDTCAFATELPSHSVDRVATPPVAA
jgi:hypothetical protein